MPQIAPDPYIETVPLSEVPAGHLVGVLELALAHMGMEIIRETSCDHTRYKVREKSE